MNFNQVKSLTIDGKRISKIIKDGRTLWSFSETLDLITFTINGVPYKSPKGITWAEWCDSVYNTDGYYINWEHDGVSTSGGKEVNNVYPNTVVVEGDYSLGGNFPV